MDLIFKDLLSFGTTRLGTIAAAALGLLAACLIAYLRGQVHAGTKWLLAPITRRLPWNQNNPIKGSVPDHETDLTSQLTVVDVFLQSMDGERARYQKTSNYVVNKDDLNAYQEGVTSAGKASRFSTMRGTIVDTRREHGFYISRIDLGDLFNKGTRFTNVYTADLHNSFMNDREHWTQEIVFPTKHLTLQIHFPRGRPPRKVKCKVVEGVSDRQVKMNAKVMELSGETCIVWEIQSPKLKDIYKLEWTW
jgi:hypothetical protein